MNNKKGFTLLELLVVIAIIGLLASIILVSLNSQTAKAKTAAFKKEIRAIQPSLVTICDGTIGASVVGAQGLGAAGTHSAGTIDTDCQSEIFQVTYTATNGITCTAVVNQNGATYTGC